MRVAARVYFLFSKAFFSSCDLLLQHKSGPMVVRSRVRDLPTPPCEPFPPPPLFPPVIPLFHPIRPSIFVQVFLFDPLLFTGFLPYAGIFLWPEISALSLSLFYKMVAAQWVVRPLVGVDAQAGSGFGVFSYSELLSSTL